MTPTLEAAIYYHVLHDAGLYTIIGRRGYPWGEVPQSVPEEQPYVAWQLTDAEHPRHMVGSSGIGRADYSLHCIAQSKLVATQLADAVREAFDNFRGDLGDPTGPISIKGCFVGTATDEYIPPQDASQRGHWDRQVLVTFWHPESATP